MIGIIGLATDMFLAWLGTVLFPWKRRTRAARPWTGTVWSWMTDSTTPGILSRLPKPRTAPAVAANPAHDAR
jgi:hypothetical protein